MKVYPTCPINLYGYRSLFRHEKSGIILRHHSTPINLSELIKTDPDEVWRILDYISEQPLDRSQKNELKEVIEILREDQEFNI